MSAPPSAGVLFFLSSVIPFRHIVSFFAQSEVSLKRCVVCSFFFAQVRSHVCVCIRKENMVRISVILLGRAPFPPPPRVTECVTEPCLFFSLWGAIRRLYCWSRTRYLCAVVGCCVSKCRVRTRERIGQSRRRDEQKAERHLVDRVIKALPASVFFECDCGGTVDSWLVGSVSVRGVRRGEERQGECRLGLALRLSMLFGDVLILVCIGTRLLSALLRHFVDIISARKSKL